ncbi:hypothetical protein [Streptomyces sp. CBMA152]|uniref:hypothetical protein n=1 Tax=Streptomyces sp. CBMA152 TaxID=1896312 RepID=UPI001660F75B|nr:hypothetical protein [Streptomyces sp. CBMA152]MBD0742784.1 hypothetical protein [Streptomyces sp. CBMA152]
MSVRRRVRAAVLALGVLASSLTFAATGATAAQAASCLKLLGPTIPINSGQGQVGIVYLGWDPCASPKKVYAEVHFSNPVSGIRGEPATDIAIYNSTVGTIRHNAWYDYNSSFWSSPLISIYSYPSTDRQYQGGFNLSWDSGAYCDGSTVMWNFSNGSYDASTAGAWCNF